MNLNDKVYDILKWIAMYLLPALGTLYFAIAQIWGFPYGEEVVGTITAVDTFLGVILGISNKGYEGDGTLVVDTTDPDKDTYTLALNNDFDILKNKDKVVLKTETASTSNSTTATSDANTSRE